MKKKLLIVVIVLFAILAALLLIINSADGDSSKTNESTTAASTEIDTTPAANTTAMVDYICSEAKKKAQTATEADEQEAIKCLSDNIDTCFSSNEVMEKFMYYGALLDYMYEDSETKSQLGFNALKTVKYVYRGEEKILDKTTQDNLQKTKDLLSAIQ